VARNGELALAVDRIRCDGYGMCAELLPELIDLDDWGFPILAAATVPSALLPLARQAVENCPVLALRLEVRTVARQRPFLAGRPSPEPVFSRSR
jgi:ferredoxin